MKGLTRRGVVKAAGAVALSIAAISLLACSSREPGPPGRSLYIQGVMKEQAGDYRAANSLYAQALPLLRREGVPPLVKDARIAVKRTGIIISDYSATYEDIRQTLSGFSGMSDDTINYLVSRIAYLDMDGARYYYNDYINTAYHIDLALMQQVPDVMERNRQGYAALKPFIETPGPTSGTPYIDPVSYEGVATYDVPRNKLPGTGLLKIWQPVPVATDCQTDVSIISVTPAGYVRTPATVNGDLGDIYLEVPLDDLTGDLRIEVRFRFRRYVQRFTMIDPDNVGTYDKDSALYREFTASAKNIFISPEIEAKAREIVGGEQNPYLAARKIYDYVVDDLTYSHTPHASLGFMDIPESVFVHEHGYGDCGAQSIYFSALCRAVGIPARATGGYQLFPGMEGTHFWAEFYLPNYGWVPVDTSVAQIYKYLPELTDDEKRAFKDFFFGSMDPYRWTIQKDVDLPLSPPAPEPTALSIVLQTPAVLCDEMDVIPEAVIGDYYSIQVTKIP